MRLAKHCHMFSLAGYMQIYAREVKLLHKSTAQTKVWPEFGQLLITSWTIRVYVLGDDGQRRTCRCISIHQRFMYGSCIYIIAYMHVSLGHQVSVMSRLNPCINTVDTHNKRVRTTWLESTTLHSKPLT